MPRKPRLGQNFLQDANASRAVVAALGEIGQDAVLEIGPGRGALTRLMSRTAARLTLIEFDATLAAGLRTEYASSAHVDVQYANILDFDLTALARDRQRRLAVIGNVPYYITSDILLHLLKHHEAIDRAVLMVQREVAERVTAMPGSSDYGVLSATMQLYGEVELLFTLPPTAFVPPPEVHSSVFRFYVRPRFAELQVSAKEFIPFLRACFAQKRKTLGNNLRAAGFKPEVIQRALQHAGLSATLRTEAVDLPAMAAVFQFLGQNVPTPPRGNPPQDVQD